MRSKRTAFLFFYFLLQKGVSKAMAQTVQDTIRERIEIVNQPEDVSEQGQKKPWLVIPIALVVIAALFFVVRRFTSKQEEF
jgi:hypothetical protein